MRWVGNSEVFTELCLCLFSSLSPTLTRQATFHLQYYTIIYNQHQKQNLLPGTHVRKSVERNLPDSNEVVSIRSSLYKLFTFLISFFT